MPCFSGRDGACVFFGGAEDVVAGYEYPHHTDPRFDLDLAAYGVCKLMPDGSLAPKQSFHAMAEACSLTTRRRRPAR